MSAVVTHQRKPDRADAALVEARVDVIEEATKWCSGVAIISFNNDGSIVESETAIKVPMKVKHNNNEATEYIDARVGMYIVKYHDTDTHGSGFYVFSKDNFESVYEKE